MTLLRKLPPVVAGLALCLHVFCAGPVSAGTTYGIYDARTMAMGGASVASANNDNAQFYNAALLAFNEDIEERTQDGRLLFPLIVPQLSESTLDLEEIASEDFKQGLRQAVRQYNTTPDMQAAQAVVDASATLDSALASLDNEDLLADIYFGTGLSEPGKLQGAGFILGVRVLAGGRSAISPADRAILASYQDGLSFVASGGAAGSERPELFDANGNLLDPTSNLESTASATGAVITEIGVAMSKQLHLFGQPLAAGITFKVLDIETFEDVERSLGERVELDRNSETDTNVNFDIGLIREFGDRWRIGLAVKDIVPHNYTSSLGTLVRLRPRPRMGAAYQRGALQIAADIDLVQNEPLGIERPTQEIAVGAEWQLGRPFKLRAGLRHDLRGNRDGVVSAGVGTRWKRLVVDVAYAQGGDARAAALQFGVAF